MLEECVIRTGTVGRLARIRNATQFIAIKNFFSDVFDIVSNETGDLGVFIDLIVPDDVLENDLGNVFNFIFSDPTDTENLDFYHKINGVDFPWLSDEPDNFDGNERCGILFYDGSISGELVDSGCTSFSSVTAFVCEVVNDEISLDDDDSKSKEEDDELDILIYGIISVSSILFLLIIIHFVKVRKLGKIKNFAKNLMN